MVNQKYRELTSDQRFYLGVLGVFGAALLGLALLVGFGKLIIWCFNL